MSPTTLFPHLGPVLRNVSPAAIWRMHERVRRDYLVVLQAVAPQNVPICIRGVALPMIFS